MDFYNEDELVFEMNNLYKCLSNIYLVHNFDFEIQIQNNFDFLFGRLSDMIVDLIEKQEMLNNIEKCQLYIVKKKYYELKYFVEYN